MLQTTSDDSYQSDDGTRFDGSTTTPALTPRERLDKSLAEAVTRHIPGAEERLARRYRSLVFSVLLKSTTDQSNAEDLTQETLMLVIRKLRDNELEKPHKLTSFILSIAKYSFIVWLRRKDNQVDVWTTLAESTGEVDGPEESYLSNEVSKKLRQLISKLPTERDREILQRCYITQQTKAEICDAMELANAHYDRVISRARTRLKLTAARLVA